MYGDGAGEDENEDDFNMANQSPDVMVLEQEWANMSGLPGSLPAQVNLGLILTLKKCVVIEVGPLYLSLLSRTKS